MARVPKAIVCAEAHPGGSSAQAGGGSLDRCSVILRVVSVTHYETG